MRFAASPIGIWGDITPKSEKIAEKCTIFFEHPIKYNAYITESNNQQRKRFERIYTRARVGANSKPQCCFFAVTSVTQQMKNE